MRPLQKVNLLLVAVISGGLVWVRIGEELLALVEGAVGAIALEVVPVDVPILAAVCVICVVVSVWGALNCRGTWWSLSLAFGALSVLSWQSFAGFPWWVFAFALFAMTALMLALSATLGEQLTG